MVPVEDGHWMVGGHRPATAAIRAELPSVRRFERLDLADGDRDQVAAMIGEGVRRKNLTGEEEANAYAPLEAFPEWTVEWTVPRTGRAPPPPPGKPCTEPAYATVCSPCGLRAGDATGASG